MTFHRIAWSVTALVATVASGAHAAGPYFAPAFRWEKSAPKSSDPGRTWREPLDLVVTDVAGTVTVLDKAGIFYLRSLDDGRLLAGKRLGGYDQEQRKGVFALPGTGKVATVASSASHRLDIWEAGTARHLGVWRLPRVGEVSSAGWESGFLAGPEGTLLVQEPVPAAWQLGKHGKVRRRGTLPAGRSFALSPDGSRVAYLEENGWRDTRVSLRPFAAREIVDEVVTPPIPGARDGILRLAFTPDGTHLVAITDTGARLFDLATSRWTDAVFGGFGSGPTPTPAFSGDGEYLSLGLPLPEARGHFGVWEWRTGRLVARVPFDQADGGRVYPPGVPVLPTEADATVLGGATFDLNRPDVVWIRRPDPTGQMREYEVPHVPGKVAFAVGKSLQVLVVGSLGQITCWDLTPTASPPVDVQEVAETSPIDVAGFEPLDLEPSETATAEAPASAVAEASVPPEDVPVARPVVVTPVARTPRRPAVEVVRVARPVPATPKPARTHTGTSAAQSWLW